MKMFKGGLLMSKIIKKLHRFMAEAERYGFETKKERIKIYIDFLHCKCRFHCRRDEYFLLKYYVYRDWYRKYFLTYWQRPHYWAYINKNRLTLSKMFMYGRLKEYYGRELFALNEHTAEEFADFVKKTGKVFVKPDRGSCGLGASVLEYVDDATCKQKYEELVKDDMICEEYIRQCKELDELCPTSINSCRIMTLRDKTETKVLAATIKMSKGESFVDNMYANGIGAAVDVKTGVVTTVGRDYEDNVYIYHPMTGKIIPGIQLPFWQETLYIVKKAHEAFPESAVLGWDIAFTPDGPIIIETNGAPGTKIHQFADKEPKGKPIMDYIAVKSNRVYDLKENNRPNKDPNLQGYWVKLREENNKKK